MIPQKHSDIIASIESAVKASKNIEDLLPLSEDFDYKRKLIQGYYNLIVIEKKTPSENDCDNIIALTPYMDQKTYAFFKQHNAVSSEKPDFKFVDRIINLQNKEYVIQSISERSPQTHLLVKSYVTASIAGIPITLSLWVLEYFFGAGKNENLTFLDYTTLAETLIFSTGVIIPSIISDKTDFTLWGSYKFSAKNVTKMIEKAHSKIYTTHIIKDDKT